MSENKTYNFFVHGMHCASCVFMIEENLKDVPGIARVKADLNKREVEIMGELGENLAEVAEKLSAYVIKHGYKLALEREKKKKNWQEFWYAVPITILLIAGFVLLQKAGLVNLVGSGEVGYGTALLLGLIASVSTCLAVVGGLVLSLSANYAKTGNAWKPQAMFHIGRLAGFFVLGGVIGALGRVFQFGLTGNIILSIVVGLVMLILGINLLDVFHSTKKLQISMPKIFARSSRKLATATHFLAPLFVGVGTFFLPCGFTQSMQVYTLTTGSFMRGALTMGIFALGTLPMLALLSFGSFRVAEQSWRGVFFKTAGLIVVVLGVVNIANALAITGIIPPLFFF